MVLLKASVNQRIDRDGFEKKAKVFAQSVYELTAEVAQYTHWEDEQINERQKRLAAIAVKTWPLTVR